MENFTVNPQTHVCSWHLKQRNKQKKNVFVTQGPSQGSNCSGVFEWKGFSVPLARPGVWKRKRGEKKKKKTHAHNNNK
ncbi:hypothetical protein AOLI_G00247870 [Acnodon oligacanthus]